MGRGYRSTQRRNFHGDGRQVHLRGNYATLLHGTPLLAVTADVMVGMDLQSADYDKAKALMAAICSRL